jgi:hypothetical protein
MTVGFDPRFEQMSALIKFGDHARAHNRLLALFGLRSPLW